MKAQSRLKSSAQPLERSFILPLVRTFIEGTSHTPCATWLEHTRHKPHASQWLWKTSKANRMSICMFAALPATRAVVCQAPSKKLSSMRDTAMLNSAEGQSRKRTGLFLPLGFRHALRERSKNNCRHCKWYAAELQSPANTLSPPETQAPPTRTSRIQPPPICRQSQEHLPSFMHTSVARYTAAMVQRYMQVLADLAKGHTHCA